MEKKYLETESGNVYTFSELETFYNSNRNSTTAETFTDYLRNCLVENNGTLQEIETAATVDRANAITFYCVIPLDVVELENAIDYASYQWIRRCDVARERKYNLCIPYPYNN